MADRFEPFDPDQLSAEARAVYHRILSERGYVPVPYQFWLAYTGFLDPIEPVEEFLRHGVSLEERLVEIVVLVVAKHWRAQYVWTSHGPAAEKAGVDSAVVEAIRSRAVPDFAKNDELVCYTSVPHSSPGARSRTISGRGCSTVSEKTASMKCWA